MPNLSEALDTPWRIWNEFGRIALSPYVRLLFALNQIPWKSGWRIFGVPVIQKHRRSSILAGVNLQLRSTRRANPLGIGHPVVLATIKEGAQLKIGDNFAMSGGSLCVVERIVIGNNVALGAGVHIVDTDFHPLNSQIRHLFPNTADSAPVVIEDDVFVGMNSIILKGVTIGRRSVVGAGSVVARDVPPGVVVAGNPAKVIREI
jgi:acetyltransferase-like isoleucine patch superfamily enzyme